MVMFSCSKDELPLFNQMNSLRIIALTTPTPEVSPGATVTLTPIISDVNSAAGLSDSVRVCLDSGISYGATPDCENNSSTVVIHTDRVINQPGAGESWTGEVENFNVNIPVDALIFLGRTDIEKTNGVNYIVEYTLKNQTETVKSFRRIKVSDAALKPVKNSNPVVTDILSDGVSLTTLPLAATISLTTNLSTSSSESYSFIQTDGSSVASTEKLSVTWMITDGESKYFRTDVGQTNTYTTPTTRPSSGRSIYILAIVRDDRGGVTMVKKKL